MWFMLKQAGVTVPSLAHVKKFALPDFTSPRTVCSMVLINRYTPRSWEGVHNIIQEFSPEGGGGGGKEI